MRRHDEACAPVSRSQLEAALADLGLVWRNERPKGGAELSLLFSGGQALVRGRMGTVLGLEVQLARRAGSPIVHFVADLDAEGRAAAYVAHRVDMDGSRSELAHGHEELAFVELEMDRVLGEVALRSTLAVLPAFANRLGILERPHRPTAPVPVDPVPLPSPRWEVREGSGEGDSAIVVLDGVPVVEASAARGEQGVTVTCRVLGGDLVVREVSALVMDLWVRERFGAGEPLTVGTAGRGGTTIRRRPSW